MAPRSLASLMSWEAALESASPPTGPHNITASYSGEPNFLPSTSSPLAQSVNQATTATGLVSSANPGYLNQPITFTATVTSQYGGAVSGTVTFKQGTTALATVALVSGQGSYGTAYTTTGTRSITAVYTGDANNAGSTSRVLSQAVNALPAATTTKVATSGSPSFINQPVNFTATITSTYGPIPNGEMVSLYDGTTLLGTGPTASGSATLTTSSLAARTHTIKATYPGDATFKASFGTITQVVNLYPSSTGLPTSSLNPSTYSQAITFTAVVTSTAPPAPTGKVTFNNGSISIGTVTINAAGVGSLTLKNLPAGALSIIAAYNGDSETAKSVSPMLSQTVNQASSNTTVKSSLNPSTIGQSVTFTVKVTSPTTTPTGTVNFMDGNTVLGTGTLSSNQASYSTSALSAGSHSITAIYAGTGNIKGSTSSVLTQVVN